MLRRKRGTLIGVALAALLAVLAGCSNRVDTGTAAVAAPTGGTPSPAGRATRTGSGWGRPCSTT